MRQRRYRRILVAHWEALRLVREAAEVLWTYEGRPITRSVIHMLVLDRMRRRYPAYMQP